MHSISIDSTNFDLPLSDKFKKSNINELQNNNPLDLQKNFLNILVTQIKNQDPTDPIKNSDLTSQLAQINTSNGIERLNIAAMQFANQMNKNHSIQLSSLIGHHIITPNDKITHTKDTSTKFGVALFNNATSVTIKITDKNNKVLHVKTIKDKEAGTYTFSWDGKDSDNKSVMTGTYNISVVAKNKDENVIAQSLSEAVVKSIIISPNGPILDLGAAGKTTSLNICEILK